MDVSRSASGFKPAPVPRLRRLIRQTDSEFRTAGEAREVAAPARRTFVPSTLAAADPPEGSVQADPVCAGSRTEGTVRANGAAAPGEADVHALPDVRVEERPPAVECALLPGCRVAVGVGLTADRADPIRSEVQAVTLFARRSPRLAGITKAPSPRHAGAAFLTELEVAVVAGRSLGAGTADPAGVPAIPIARAGRGTEPPIAPSQTKRALAILTSLAVGAERGSAVQAAAPIRQANATAPHRTTGKARAVVRQALGVRRTGGGAEILAGRMVRDAEAPLPARTRAPFARSAASPVRRGDAAPERPITGPPQAALHPLFQRRGCVAVVLAGDGFGDALM